MNSKTIAESRSTITTLMLPEHANPAGNVHGGEIMKIMDHCAGITTVRHCRKNTVTARVDQLEFHLPIHIGNLVTCTGELTFVGRSSMEVAVTLLVEDIQKDDNPRVALTAYFTMVALDENGRPAVVPQLRIETPEEQALFDEGKIRYAHYKEKQKKTVNS